jgi:transcriptional regulator with XRE-family HTH domain
MFLEEQSMCLEEQNRCVHRIVRAFHTHRIVRAFFTHREVQDLQAHLELQDLRVRLEEQERRMCREIQDLRTRLSFLRVCLEEQERRMCREVQDPRTHPELHCSCALLGFYWAPLRVRLEEQERHMCREVQGLRTRLSFLRARLEEQEQYMRQKVQVLGTYLELRDLHARFVPFEKSALVEPIGGEAEVFGNLAGTGLHCEHRWNLQATRAMVIKSVTSTIKPNIASGDMALTPEATEDGSIVDTATVIKLMPSDETTGTATDSNNGGTAGGNTSALSASNGTEPGSNDGIDDGTTVLSLPLSNNSGSGGSSKVGLSPTALNVIILFRVLDRKELYLSKEKKQAELKPINRMLKWLRTSEDLTKTELSERIPVSLTYISEIETGKKTPSLKVIGYYGEYFNIRTSSLIYLAEETITDSDSNLLFKILEKKEDKNEKHKVIV